jgi:hypothetical protein
VPHLLGDVPLGGEDEALAGQSRHCAEASTFAGDDGQIGVIVVVVVVESASHDAGDERRDERESEYEGGDEERGGRGPDVQARLAAGSGSACVGGDGKAAEWFR